jgi:branched-chain amino acid transport system substrate-binding protein
MFAAYWRLSYAEHRNHGTMMSVNRLRFFLGFAASAILKPFAVASVALIAAACTIGGGGGLGLGSGSQGGAQLNAAGGAQNPGAIKVAFLLPMGAQGNAQSVAKALKQAGELALFDFDNPNIQLVPKDTLGTPEGARAAAQEAVKEGAELIIGPLFAAEVSAAAPEAQRASLPIVAFSSDRKVAGNGVYLLSFLAGSDVPRIVSYAASRGKKRFAALVPQTDSGRLVEQSLLAAASQQGGQVVAVKSYPQDANGMITPVRDIATLARKGQPPQIDALLVVGGAETMPSLAPLLSSSEIDTQQVKLVGTGSWDYPGVGKEEALAGGWFPAPDPKGWTDFTKRYVETYGDVPPRLASLAYDAVSLAVSLSNNPKGKRYTASQLTRSAGFAGIDGLFRLRPDGTSERGFAILEVQRYGNEVIDVAPNSFGSTPQY